MNPELIRKIIAQTQADRAQLYGESTIHDSLKANSADDGGVGSRVRSHARKAEVNLLNRMKECLDAVIELNPEIKATADALAKIERTTGALEQRESWEAMWQAQKRAEEALVEQTNLRTLLLMTVKEAASSLAPRDGRSAHTETPSQVLFDGGPGLFGQPEPDQATAMLEAVNATRTHAAQRGHDDVSDDEFARLLGVFD
ncbi:MAG: hypothetical protein AAGA29_06865 [Planctomycetota bacterium]